MRFLLVVMCVCLAAVSAGAAGLDDLYDSAVQEQSQQAIAAKQRFNTLGTNALTNAPNPDFVANTFKAWQLIQSDADKVYDRAKQYCNRKKGPALTTEDDRAEWAKLDADFGRGEHEKLFVCRPEGPDGEVRLSNEGIYIVVDPRYGVTYIQVFKQEGRDKKGYNLTFDSRRDGYKSWRVTGNMHRATVVSTVAFMLNADKTLVVTKSSTIDDTWSSADKKTAWADYDQNVLAQRISANTVGESDLFAALKVMTYGRAAVAPAVKSK
jgi:hypothetical protein